MSTQYDAIIIGTGAGGGALTFHLAQAGKNILILERGPFMPQEKLNGDTETVFLDHRYHDESRVEPAKSLWVTEGFATCPHPNKVFRLRCYA